MDRNELAKRLQEIREGKGLSQRDLSELSKVHFNTISGIESRGHKPRPSTLRRLAEALDVDVEDLTGAPKGEAPLFSDVPTRGPVERRVDYLTAPTALVEGVESWLREQMAAGAGLEVVERAAWFHRLFLDRAVERYGLTRSTSDLPPEEARALERLAVALDDLRSTVDEGYGFAIDRLVDRKAEVEQLGERRGARADSERRTAERETRSA